MFNPLNLIFKKRIASVLGIDIGTSSIKLAELKREGENKFQLLNYAIMETSAAGEETGGRGLSFDLKDADLARFMKLLKKEAGIGATDAVMSLPVFSTFVTVMHMPLLEEKDLASAVPLQAREYIPIPISEVVLDWKLIRTTKKSDLTRASLPVPASASDNRGQSQSPLTDRQHGEGGGERIERRETGMEVLLMAAPREMVQKYVRIAQMAGLAILGLEIESFALARAIAGGETGPIAFFDVGALSASISVFDEGFLRVVHHAEISSADFTRACARALGTDLERAEAQKRERGLYASGGEAEIAAAYLPLLEAMAREVERVLSMYWRVSMRQIARVVLAGDAALLKGLAEYLSARLRIPVTAANPFTRVSLPKDLLPFSQMLGAELANAIGLAMKEI